MQYRRGDKMALCLSPENQSIKIMLEKMNKTCDLLPNFLQSCKNVSSHIFAVELILRFPNGEIYLKNGY